MSMREDPMPGRAGTLRETAMTIRAMTGARHRTCLDGLGDVAATGEGKSHGTESCEVDGDDDEPVAE